MPSVPPATSTEKSALPAAAVQPVTVPGTPADASVKEAPPSLDTYTLPSVVNTTARLPLALCAIAAHDCDPVPVALAKLEPPLDDACSSPEVGATSRVLPSDEVALAAQSPVPRRVMGVRVPEPGSRGMVGAGDGATVGALEGACVGACVGAWVGLAEGVCVGVTEGTWVGSCVGGVVGTCVGAELGAFDGKFVGAVVGCCEGARVGSMVGSCAFVCEASEKDGRDQGWMPAAIDEQSRHQSLPTDVGALEGAEEGDLVGAVVGSCWWFDRMGHVRRDPHLAQSHAAHPYALAHLRRRHGRGLGRWEGRRGGGRGLRACWDGGDVGLWGPMVLVKCVRRPRL